MNEYLLGLIQKYKARGVLTDTNILILYIIDSFDPNLIGTSKATSQFTQDDFLRAAKFIDYFDVKVTTPHVLTEVSNLLKDRADLHIALRKYVELSEEKYINSEHLSKAKTFPGFGLADTAINEAAKGLYLVITNDGKLFGYLESQKADVVNLDQIRMI